MYLWERQKELIRGRLEECFEEAVKYIANRLTIHIEVEPNRPPEFEYTVHSIMIDHGDHDR